jgi:1-aminocyclopropane-1-carboxylate deaminase
MNLIFVDREAYRDKHTLFNQHFADDTNAFFIDEGGASPEAARGVSELVDELPETYDHIFCACGTGTMAAGIINGLQTHLLNTQMHGIPVFKNGGFFREAIDNLLLQPREYHLHTDYHFGGYGKVNAELIGFIKRFVADTGILIDPVYTGKMLYAIYDMASNGQFELGSKILAVHSGGIWGLLGMKDKFV